MMRCGIVAAVALAAALSSTGAQAEEWCGYAAQDNAVIECGYSTIADCQTATGKGGTCFVDPDYALNTKHTKPVLATKLSAPHG
jgi:Protein of unknown function (DUF3551)